MEVVDYYGKYFDVLWGAHTEIVLRDKQIECFNRIMTSIFDAKYNGSVPNRRMAQAPTGFGKTIIFSHIITLFKYLEPLSSILVVLDQKELIEQTIDKLVLCSGTYDYDFEIHSLIQTDVDLDANLVLAMIQTLRSSKNKRMKYLSKNKKFDLIIFDECHMCTSKGYQDAINLFTTDAPVSDEDDLFSSSERTENDTQILGLSATPFFSSKKKDKVFRETFKRCVFKYSTIDAITREELANVIYYRGETNISLNDVRIMSTGEFDSTELNSRINVEARHQFILDKIREISDKHDIGKVKIFCEGVAHTEDLCDFLARNGVRASYVVGTTPAAERARVIEEYDKAPMGELNCLLSCGCLTKGFDCPSIEMVVVAKPIIEASLYVQIAGRGLRIIPGIKDTCIVLDIVDALSTNKEIQNLMTTMFGLEEDLEGNIKEIFRKPPSIDPENTEPTDPERRIPRPRQEVTSVVYAFSMMAVPRHVRESGLRFIGVGKTDDGDIYTCSIGPNEQRIELIDNMDQSKITMFRNTRVDTKTGDIYDLVKSAKSFLMKNMKKTRVFWDQKYFDKSMAGGITKGQSTVLLREKNIERLTQMKVITCEDDIINMTKKEACLAIDKLVAFSKIRGTSTDSQIGFIKYLRYQTKSRMTNTDIEQLSLNEAKAVIDHMKNTGKIEDLEKFLRDLKWS